MRRSITSLLAAMLALSGCDKARTTANGADACVGCHGDPANGNAAPPRSVHGALDATDPAVGAHQAHLSSGVACGECHVVPASVADHVRTVDGHAAVTFGPIATAKGAAAVWDPTQRTCSTYCHGATLPGGAATTPVWTQLDGSQRACDACHGAPPPASTGHPATGSDPAGCAGCHPDTVRPDGTIDVGRGKHVNGTVDVGALGCASCHGDPTRASNPAAPPQGSKGETATTARAVGAHQSHLTAGAVYGALLCGDCHVVPTDTSHVDGVATVTFGALARTGGTATWDGTTCAVYCHGATLAAGGSNTAPVWTKVDGTQAACGTCHGVPPPTSTGHPAVPSALTGCASCHPATMNADGTVNVAGGSHIDGQVEAAGGSCNSCHGNAQNNAPPKGTHGETLTTALAVGAHQSHVTGTALRSAPLACTECHVVPDGVTPHPSGTLNVTFGALATTGGAKPSFTAASATCSGVYCHGATLSAGGSATAPVWTRVDGSQIQCTSCHGAPPPAPHPQNSACGSCHTGYTATQVNQALHMNGGVEVANLTCTSCHGDAAQTATATSPRYAAPPLDTQGASTGLRVGAHQTHLVGKSYSSGMSCPTCHAAVGSYTTAHANGTTDVGFSGAASANLRAGTYTARTGTTAATCSSTWCHAVTSRSGTSSGGSTPTPSWSGTITACGACHGTPPGTGHHGINDSHTTCGNCHAGYTSTAVNTTLHVNGTRDVGGSGTQVGSTWNATARTCAPACHTHDSSMTW